MRKLKKGFLHQLVTSLVAQMVKRLPAMQETGVRFLGWEDPLEKEMAIHSSTLAWKIPWMEEPDKLQSMGSQRVGHDWATSLSLGCSGREHLTYLRGSTPQVLPGEKPPQAPEVSTCQECWVNEWMNEVPLTLGSHRWRTNIIRPHPGINLWVKILN